MTEEDYNYYLEQTKLGNEIWKDIKDYLGYYQVSNLGRFRSLDREVRDCNGVIKPLRGKISNLNRKEGYQAVTLYKGGLPGRSFLIHRLVAITFIPNPEHKPIVNHLDGKKQNNVLSNLVWCTASENTQWAYDIGLQLKGEDHSRAKLKNDQVLEVCRLIDETSSSFTEVSRKMNVEVSLVRKIHYGEVWNHLTSRKGKYNTVKQQGKNHHGARAVINCRGEVFDTVAEACRTYKLESTNVCKTCSGGKKYAGKYEDGTPIKWSYYKPQIHINRK